MNDNCDLMTVRDWLPGSELVGEGSVRWSRVSTDSRNLRPGDLFVALKGDRFDGSEFLVQAKAAGASAALCSRLERVRLIESGLSGLLVDDARISLGQMATRWRDQFAIPLIAVTGSNGKTTVTQMIGAILRAWKADQALVTQGNLNNDIGVPLTLMNLRQSHEVAVVELGMNHPGEIACLANMASPTVALVNNAQREHQEYMHSVEAVARENGSVFDALGANGVAVFPADDGFTRLWREMVAGRRMCTFALDRGHAPNADVCLSEPPIWGRGTWKLSVDAPEGVVNLRLAIAGLHNVRNALAAVACAVSAGVPLAEIEIGLNRFVPVKGRSMAAAWLVAGVEWTLVDDTYNANPDSVLAAVDLLCSFPGPRLLVLGDMGEVGVEGAAMHAEVGRYAAQCGVDRVLTLGSLSAEVAKECPQATHFHSWDEFQHALTKALPSARSVLVKGSRFMKMERAVELARSWVQGQCQKGVACVA